VLTIACYPRVVRPLLPLVCFVFACSPNPTGGTRGGTDAGGRDGAVEDVDAGPNADAGPTRDAGRALPDAGPECPVGASCDPFFDRACPGGESCRPRDGIFSCMAHEAEPFEFMESCTTGASCGAGLLCLDFGDGFRCHALCPEGSSGTCPSGFECRGSLGVECVGVCQEARATCDIYAQDCPTATDACVPTFDEMDEPITACAPAGDRAPGDTCGSGIGNCQRGYVCTRTSETTACRQVCDEESDCTGGGTCTGTISEWLISYCAL